MFGEVLLFIQALIAKAYENPMMFAMEGGAVSFSMDLKTFHIFHPRPPENLRKEVQKANTNDEVGFFIELNSEPCISMDYDKEEVEKNVSEFFRANKELQGIVKAGTVSPALVAFKIEGDLKAARIFAAQVLNGMKFINKGEILCAEDGEVYKFSRGKDVPVLEAERFEGRPISDDDILNLKIALGQTQDSQEFINMMFG